MSTRSENNRYKFDKCRSCSAIRFVSVNSISDECPSCAGQAGHSTVRHSASVADSRSTSTSVATASNVHQESPALTAGPSLVEVLDAVKMNTIAFNELKESQVEQTIQLSETLEALYDLTAGNMSKIEAIEARIPSPDRELKDLRELQNEVRELTIENHHLQQRLLEKTIEIRGIPHRKEECLSELVISVADALGVRLELSDIDTVSRSRSGKSSSGLPMVVVSFTRSSIVEKMLSAARKLEHDFNTEDLGWSEDSVHRIYLHESLTSYSKSLFLAARAAKKNKIVKHAWTRHGTVYIRKDDNSPVIRVTTIQDIPEKHS